MSVIYSRQDIDFSSMYSILKKLGLVVDNYIHPPRRQRRTLPKKLDESLPLRKGKSSTSDVNDAKDDNDESEEV